MKTILTMLLLATVLTLTACTKETIKPALDQSKDNSGPKNNLGTAD